jgi:hypothetical protein
MDGTTLEPIKTLHVACVSHFSFTSLCLRLTFFAQRSEASEEFGLTGIIVGSSKVKKSRRHLCSVAPPRPALLLLNIRF